MARHYQQLRTGHGTVLLGEPTPARTQPRLERAWFIDGCPLDPNAALEAIRRRHEFATRTEALRALRAAREQLRKGKHPDAAALDDLP